MRSQAKKVAGASLLALLLTLALLAPEARAGIGQVFAVIRQVFGAPVGVSGTPSDNQVLTYDASTGKWGAEDAGGGLSGVTEDGGTPNVVTVADALNVGTTTDAVAAGDFSAGLTGSSRLTFDQSAQKVSIHDSSGNADVTLSEDSGYAAIDGANGLRAYVNGAPELELTATALFPAAAGGLDLGSASNEWEDAYLKGTIYLNNSQLARIYYTADGGGSFILNTSGDSINMTANDKVTLANAARNKGVVFDVSDNALRPINWGTDIGTAITEWEDAYLRGTIYLGAGQNATIRTGTGSPESAVTAPVASIFLRYDGGAGTALYVKESGTGNTGWIPITSQTVVESTNDGRLSVHSTDPLGEGSSSSILYLHRYTGSRMALYDGSSEWSYLTIAATPVSIALSGGTASRPHDVFAYDSSGTIALELVAWTDDTTRATALTTQDGVRVKSGDTTRRYLGSVYLDGSKQATFDSSARGLWNADNRVRWESSVVDTTNSWTYTTATWRQANGSSSNQVQLMLGRSEETVEAWTACMVASTGGNPLVTTGVGIDSSTSNSAQVTAAVRTIGSMLSAQSRYAGRPAAGLRDVRWLEISEATGTVTWYGDNGTTYAKSGMVVTSWH